MAAEVAASQLENYTPNYELIKRNELVRTENKRTYIRNMDDSISDFFSFTTQDLQNYINDALDNYDYSGVIDMDALNASITQQVNDAVDDAIENLDIQIPEPDLTEVRQELQEYVEELVEESLANITVINGTDGKSAYQYAVEGGYTGTEAQFSVQLNRVLSLIDAEEIGY